MTGASSPEPVEKVREKIHVFFLPKTHVCYIAFLYRINSFKAVFFFEATFVYLFLFWLARFCLLVLNVCSISHPPSLLLLLPPFNFILMPLSDV